MDYFPAFLNLKDRSCLLVGGGVVASRKADLLLAAGAQLTVVAPEICPPLKRYVTSGRITHRVGRFTPSDVHGHWLVVNASDDPEISSVKAGSLDDTSWLRPVGHIWTRSRQPWVDISDAPSSSRSVCLRSGTPRCRGSPG